jgi:hypothetical protein
MSFPASSPVVVFSQPFRLGAGHKFGEPNLKFGGEEILSRTEVGLTRTLMDVNYFPAALTEIDHVSAASMADVNHMPAVLTDIDGESRGAMESANVDRATLTRVA